MSCSSCPAGALNNISVEEVANCGKLAAYDWLNALPEALSSENIVEVQFKNTRKDFFVNASNLLLKRNEYVAVDAGTGHDIGRVALTGKMAVLQLKRKKEQMVFPEKVIYRKATTSDMEKYNSARQREKEVMISARKIAESLKLDMKISDVEFQGDGTKATFYYIADKRVDFRELIKVYARSFNVRIEMRQIGARQEAAMVGGIGSCGNTLCCSTWRTNLDSVTSNAARIQQLPHNLQKLTGQCGKLKCCLMYELDHYFESELDFPDMLLELETVNGIAYPQKKDILNKKVYYSYGKEDKSKLFALSTTEIHAIIQRNKRGEKVKINEQAVILNEEVRFKSFENNLDIFSKKGSSKKQRNIIKQKRKKQ
jgi:cell fate regulator YaaT (PSP1 superfamily)